MLNQVSLNKSDYDFLSTRLHYIQKIDLFLALNRFTLLVKTRHEIYSIWSKIKDKKCINKNLFAA